MSLTPGQLAIRRTGLGGSEIAAIFGLDKFKTPLDVYLAKVEGWEPARNDDMMRGDHLEDGVALWYGEKHQVEVVNPGSTFKHQSREHVVATPDRLVTTALGGTELLSIKVPRRADEWGEDETGDYPSRYNIQVQVEAAVLGSHGYVLAGGWIAAPVWGDLRRYPVRLDEQFQETLMLSAERWWAKHVEAQNPPDLDAGEGAREWVLKRYPGVKRDEKSRKNRSATLAETALCMQLKEAEAAKEAAEEKYEALRRYVETAIGEDDALVGSFGRVSWLKNQWNKRTLRTRWARSN